MDDSILLGPEEQELKRLKELIASKFDIQGEGDLCDYLGIQIKRQPDGMMSLTQPHLIESILKDLKLNNKNATGRKTPALKTVLLHKDENGKAFNNDFHYRSVIGKLNYLEKSTRTDIAYAVHQCARFSSNPKQSHADAVKYICRYLAGTKEKGRIIKPENNTFECFVDASHAGDWNQQSAVDDPATAKSRTGYIL